MTTNGWLDFYQILGVDLNASQKEIKEAWKKRQWWYHPDRMQGAPQSARDEAEQQLKTVNLAFETLSNPQKRSQYDSKWKQAKQHSGDNAPPKPPPPKSEPPPSPKPNPVVTPNYIHFDNAEPNKTYTASFVIKNAGGTYSKFNFTRPNSWLKVIRWSSLTKTDELPTQVEVQGIGTEWNKTYTESITVNLDQEATTVKVELVTKPFPSVVPDSKLKGKSTFSWAKLLVGVFAIVAIITIIAVIANSNNPSPANTNSTKTQTSTQPDIPGTSLSLGASHNSVVDTNTNTRDVYAISLTAGQPVQINVTGYSGQLNFVFAGSNSTSFNGNKYTELYNTMGQEYTGNPWSLTFFPTTSGTYYFAVNAYKGTQSYTIAVTTLKSSPIQYGQQVTGTIQKGNNQYWLFTGQAGDIVTIQILQDGGASLSPAIDLFDSSGSKVNGTENGAASKVYTLGLTDSYIIKAYGLNGSIGGYRLTLGGPQSSGSIAYRQEVTGKIALPGDYKYWLFTGQAGDIVTIQILQDGGASLSPAIDLFDSSGSEVNGTNYGAAKKVYTLRFSGSYSIYAYGLSGSVGGYKLTLGGPQPSESIAYGQEVTGKIALSGDYKDWLFTGQAGDIVTIQMLQDGGASLSPAIDLFDSSGSEVNGTNYGAAKKVYTLRFSGSYVIHAYGLSGSVGDYRLQIIRK